MCRVENTDNMEVTKTNFHIPCIFIVQRRNIIIVSVSKNKACGLNLLGLCYFFTTFQLDNPGQVTLTLCICLFHLEILVKIK